MIKYSRILAGSCILYKAMGMNLIGDHTSTVEVKESKMYTKYVTNSDSYDKGVFKSVCVTKAKGM